MVRARDGDALYFSRAAIPHRREGGPSPLARAHVGIYAFREPFLQEFAALAPGRLEREESLEQLRALEAGHRIRVVETRYGGFGVDTPEDLERARALLGGGRRAGLSAGGRAGGRATMVKRTKKTKYVFVTGGVVSSLGKGLAAASIGALMENRGLEVTHIKLDPYINVDPGTMSPYQHGEVYVTDDGAETDLDLGHYERFTSARMTAAEQLHDRPHLQRPSSRRSGAASTSARPCR